MGDKYTLKDFLSYFLTGLFLVVIVGVLYHQHIMEYCLGAKIDLPANSALVIFMLIPCCYLLGQFVHGIDMIVFDILMVVSDFSRRDALRKHKLLAPLRFISFLLNGHRITERLKDQPMDSALFWKACSRLVANGKYDKSDYWSVLHLLAEGLVSVSFFWLVWFTIHFDRTLFWVFLSLTIVFWYRCRWLARTFISSVQNSIAALDAPAAPTAEAK